MVFRSNKVKSFSSVSTNVYVKATEQKLITVNADRDLFRRLLVAANTQQINLREVLSYYLSPVPFSMAHQDRSLRKTTKSTLCSILEKNVTVLPRLFTELTGWHLPIGWNPVVGELLAIIYSITVRSHKPSHSKTAMRFISYLTCTGKHLSRTMNAQDGGHPQLLK